MKTTLILILLVIFSVSLTAHPAEAISLQYDASQKMLTANVTHSSQDISKHYTQTVMMKINKRNALTQNLILQDSKEGGVYQYRLNDVKPGDTVTITTDCSLGGRKSASLKIE